jgi:hypothetical protein
MRWKRHPNHNTRRASGKACPDDCAYLRILTWGAEYWAKRWSTTSVKWPGCPVVPE